MFICRWHDTAEIPPRNPKDSTKKLLELRNVFSKVAGYKINIQKLGTFLYANNELTERETKETIAFTIATKTIKYLGIKLTKDVKDLTQKIIRHQRQKLKNIQINGSTHHVHGCEELTSIKISVLLEAIYGCNAIPIKILMKYFTELK